MRTTTPRLAALILGGVDGAPRRRTGAAHRPPSTTHPTERSNQEILLQDPLYAIRASRLTCCGSSTRRAGSGSATTTPATSSCTCYRGDSPSTSTAQKRTTIRAGEAYHEALDKVMQARNASTTEATTILLFQVGDEGERMTVVTDR